MRIKHFFIGLLLFILFYLEPLSIGPLKFSHLWKIPVLLFLIHSVRLKIKRDAITGFSLLYYLKYLLTTGFLFFGYYADGFYMFVRGISIPIIYNYLNIKSFKDVKLSEAIIFFSNFIILSSVPFIVNIIEPLGSGYGLESYGSETLSGFVGIFQNPHGAAICVSQALITILFFIIKKRKINLLNILILGIGFFVLYKTYVRTGYVMFSIGAVLILYLEYGFRKFYKLIPVLGIFVIVSFYLYSGDKLLRGRVTQHNIYNQGEELSVDRISSGRLTLSLINLENFAESDIFTQMFGMGFWYSTDLMNDKIGMRKASHNGFVDALVHNGFLGFIFYLLFLHAIFKLIRANRNNYFYSLSLGSYISFIIFQLLQGGNIFLLEVQLLLIISLLKKTSNNTERSNLI